MYVGLLTSMTLTVVPSFQANFGGPTISFPVSTKFTEAVKEVSEKVKDDWVTKGALAGLADHEM